MNIFGNKMNLNYVKLSYLWENLEIVKTQRNSTQLKVTLKELALELDKIVTCSTTITTTNFSATSRQAWELKFGTDTH